jgi:hypothetical protein
MTAVDIQADLEYMDVGDRKCYYPSGGLEDFQLKMHNNYTQASCILECQITYALERMRYLGEEPCVPWYLPTLGTSRMCNPWNTLVFNEHIELLPNDQCRYCLTDCRSTSYSKYVSTAPFRRCDSKNLGISNLCNLEDKTLRGLPILGERILKEYRALPELPKYVDGIQSNVRHYNKAGVVDDDDDSYNAYEKDIAVVHFYFESPTIFQYTRSPQSSWVDFLSDVGGLLGLCLGFSVCMLMEVVYWSGFRLWHDIRTHQDT